MRTHLLRAELWLPLEPAAVFPFFADAGNLEVITPPWIRFSIRTPGPISMGTGTLIDYRMGVHGVPMRWRTEITGWKPPLWFVDEQRRGPYRLWIHTHYFIPKDGGTLCRDEVEYAVPGGTLVNRLFVRRDLKRIFTYRHEALLRHFGAGGEPRAKTISLTTFGD
jgi:ligand-binding SRPBCC domain-containing protein